MVQPICARVGCKLHAFSSRRSRSRSHWIRSNSPSMPICQSISAVKVSGNGRTASDRRAGGRFRPGRPRRRACRVAGRGRPDAEIILVNVQNLEMLDISDISAVMTVEVDRRLAARQSRTALRRAVALCRKAAANFATRAEMGPREHRPRRAQRPCQSDRNGFARSWQPR